MEPNGNKQGIGDGNNSNRKNDGRKSSDAGENSAERKGNKDSGIMKIVKEPWFIGVTGGFLWLVICIVVIVIACRRRKRKRPSYMGEQSNGKPF